MTKVNKNYVIQSVLLNSNRFTLKQAVHYMVQHGFIVKKVDETNNFFRFRQVSPAILKREGYTTFITKVIVPREVEYVIAYKD